MPLAVGCRQEPVTESIDHLADASSVGLPRVETPGQALAADLNVPDFSNDARSSPRFSTAGYPAQRGIWNHASFKRRRANRYSGWNWPTSFQK